VNPATAEETSDGNGARLAEMAAGPAADRELAQSGPIQSTKIVRLALVPLTALPRSQGPGDSRRGFFSERPDPPHRVPTRHRGAQAGSRGGGHS
jgi:hypothetical protein